MPRQRTLHADQATDEDVCKLSIHARYVWLMLPCHADNEGRIDDRPGRLKAEILPADVVEMDDLLEEIVQAKLITRGAGFIRIVDFLRWQRSSPYYGPEWLEARRSCLERDHFRCQGCGYRGPLDVHHRVPLRQFKTTAEANRLENLIALCRACHAHADAAYRLVGVVFGEASTL
jgi:hypothetical protein